MTDERSNESQQPEVPESGRAGMPGQHDAHDSCGPDVPAQSVRANPDSGCGVGEFTFKWNPYEKLSHQLHFAHREFLRRFGYEPDFFLVSRHLLDNAWWWVKEHEILVTFTPEPGKENEIRLAGKRVVCAECREEIVIPVKLGFFPSDYGFFFPNT